MSDTPVPAKNALPSTLTSRILSWEDRVLKFIETDTWIYEPEDPPVLEGGATFTFQRTD